MRWGSLAGLIAIASLVAAPAADAADRFVDDGGGGGAPCTDQGNPCPTIGTAVGASGANDVIHVGGGMYAEAVTLGNGISLIRDNFSGGGAPDTSGTATIDASTGPSVHVTSAAGTISGFTILGNNATATQAPLRLSAPAIVENNLFNDDGVADNRPHVSLGATAADAVIRTNTFADDGTGRQIGIATASTGSPQISSNDLSGFYKGIEVTGGSPTVSGNEIAGTHDDAGGAAINVFQSPSPGFPISMTIVGNSIHSPADPNTIDAPVGIALFEADATDSDKLSASVRRNNVRGGFFIGIRVGNTSGAVTVESNLVTGNGNAMRLEDTTDTDPVGVNPADATVTNLTTTDNSGGDEIILQDASITVNSSYFGATTTPIGIIDSEPLDPETCSIEFSAGPPPVDPLDVCQVFQQSNANPLFVNSPSDPGPDDFHLQPLSPLINQGDPADPGPLAADIDNEVRQAAPTCGAPVRRDIGADELVRDCAPPETQIDSGPPALTRDPAASIAFSSEPSARFDCSLDGAAFASCTSPYSLLALTDGQHTFAVRATDTAGNTDLSPATRTWTVDTTPPDTEISSGPADGALTKQGSPGFAYTSEPDAVFECSIDGGQFDPCTSPSNAAFSDGAHTFAVRAIDAAGNVDASPASRSFRIDTTPPDTTIRGLRIRGDTARVRFTAGETASFECQLDGRSWRPCKSPKRFVKLFDGKHVVRIKATDEAGNVEKSPARQRIRINDE